MEAPGQSTTHHQQLTCRYQILFFSVFDIIDLLHVQLMVILVIYIYIHNALLIPIYIYFRIHIILCVFW